MKGIRSEGYCPVCGKRFKWDKRKGYLCLKHKTTPQRYTIDFYYKGERIRRGTDFTGKTIRTFADAHALLNQAENEKKAKKFDRARWKSKERLEFRFSHLVYKWYGEKEKLMEQGRRAPGYVPKLMTYIKNYFLPFYGDIDVREILNCKDFAAQLPDMRIRKTEPISLKYQKNILDGLKGFFKWLREERMITEVPVFPAVVVPEYEPQTLTRTIQDKILKLIDPEHRHIFTFLFKQGCRPGEATALMGDCISQDVVTYRRTFSGRKLIERTKNKRIRHNLIFPEVMAALPKHIFPQQFVFVHGKETKRPYSNDYLNKVFKATLQKFNKKHHANLNISLYEATKHSFGTQLINEGVPEHLLQKWFGHSKAEMTQRYAKMKVVDAFRNLQNIIEIHRKVRADSQ